MTTTITINTNDVAMRYVVEGATVALEVGRKDGWVRLDVDVDQRDVLWEVALLLAARDA